MKKMSTAAAAALTSVLLIGLAACSSGSEGEHDHGAHDHASHSEVEGNHQDDSHEGHDHGGDAATESPGLTKIEPSADYPLTTCVVSDEPLDAMGGPIAFTYEGEEVQFCCKGCVDEFEDSPETYLAKVREARKR